MTELKEVEPMVLDAVHTCKNRKLWSIRAQAGSGSLGSCSTFSKCGFQKEAVFIYISQRDPEGGWESVRKTQKQYSVSM